ncbi:hypothetical protein [Pseudomonas aeruginosa]|uniref:hypothetical protein n=1 Tax=Pseudomonas aeruginosa TaxID=287 RepID=UPI000EB60A0D|nr:hypothetical protein [Pseudomonas aeruginosa]
MQSVTYRKDSSRCTTYDYEQEPDKYAGNIECPECKERSWYVRATKTKKSSKAAYFAAHHKDGCDAGTITLIVEDEDAVPPEGLDPSRINVDLDKRRLADIIIPENSDKPSIEDPRWGNVQRRYANASEYPVNKSLRQILTYLIRNPAYPGDDRGIRIFADNGVTVVEGKLQELLVHQSQLEGVDVGSVRLFWGTITNIKPTEDGVLWLNTGDYLTEPSLIVRTEDLQDDLISDFRLGDMSRLQGARFIVIGWLYRSARGKPIIAFGFSKYIAFVKYKADESTLLDE